MESGNLRSELLDHEERVGQLLDTKLEEHRARVAELLATHMAQLCRGTVCSTGSACPCSSVEGPRCCSRQGSRAAAFLTSSAGLSASRSGDALAAHTALPRGAAAPCAQAHNLRGSGRSVASSFLAGRLLPSLAVRRPNRCSSQSDYWTNVVNSEVEHTEEVLRRETRKITQGQSANVERRKSSMVFRRQPCAKISTYNSVASWFLLAYRSQLFELCLALLIVLNSVSIGLLAEWSMQHRGEDMPVWFNIANMFFASAFTIEIVIRLLAEGRWFVSPSNVHFGWNIFDSLLMLLGLIEEILRLLAVSKLKMSFMRLARLMRLVKVLRLLRLLRFFKELRVMVFGIINCAKPLAWAALLLGMLSYIFVVFLLQVSAVWLDDNFSDTVQAREATDRTIGEYFPSLIGGMYTLFKSVSGGLNWSDPSDSLMEISPFLVLAFCMYIVVGIFCVCNVITSVFLEAANAKKTDEEAVLLEHIQSKQEWMQDARSFMAALLEEEHLDIASEDGMPTISWASFEALVQLPRTKAFFQEQGLDMYFETPKAVFELIDLDQSGSIDLNEFIVGLHRLKGGARALDMHLEMRQTMKRIDKLRDLTFEAYHILHALGSKFDIFGRSEDGTPASRFDHHRKLSGSEAIGFKFDGSGRGADGTPSRSREQRVRLSGSEAVGSKRLDVLCHGSPDAAPGDCDHPSSPLGLEAPQAFFAVEAELGPLPLPRLSAAGAARGGLEPRRRSTSAVKPSETGGGGGGGCCSRKPVRIKL